MITKEQIEEAKKKHNELLHSTGMIHHGNNKIYTTKYLWDNTPISELIATSHTAYTENIVYILFNFPKFLTALEEAQEEIERLKKDNFDRIIQAQQYHMDYLNLKEEMKLIHKRSDISAEILQGATENVNRIRMLEEALKFYKVAFDGGELAREALEGK